MTKQEEIMYEIIGAITDTDLPIVFKGCLVLKLLLKENGFEEIERMTRDIDASWIETAPTMAVIAGEINQCLEPFYKDNKKLNFIWDNDKKEWSGNN